MKFNFLIIFLLVFTFSSCSYQIQKPQYKQQDLKPERSIKLNPEKSIQELNIKTFPLEKVLFIDDSHYTSVTSKAIVSCGKLSINSCKEQAYTKALENAAKQGADIFIHSFSELDKGIITRDEIRTKMIAKVVEHTVIDQGMDGESGYFYKIKALVKRIKVPISNIIDSKPIIQKSPSNIRQQVPKQIISSKKPGLLGQYFNLPPFSDVPDIPTKPSYTKVVPTINFNWQHRIPAKNISPDYFYICWKGEILAKITGTHSFKVHFEHMGGMTWTEYHIATRVKINDNLIADSWYISEFVRDKDIGDHLFLEAGTWYPISVEVFDKEVSTANISLRWRPPGSSEYVVIPNEYFRH